MHGNGLGSPSKGLMANSTSRLRTVSKIICAYVAFLLPSLSHFDFLEFSLLCDLETKSCSSRR